MRTTAGNFLLYILTMLGFAAGISTLTKDRAPHDPANNPVIEQTMIESGKGWLLDSKSVTSLHASCIYQKDAPKALQAVTEHNKSLYARIYGETRLTPCILKDDASLADIQATALKSLNLDSDAVVGDIRQGSSNDFAEGGYPVLTVHVMAQKVVGIAQVNHQKPLGWPEFVDGLRNRNNRADSEG